jgi:2-polyprenyl-6-methoxyphenol hydroxylase-like FAD-dependent oxidoreductase
MSGYRGERAVVLGAGMAGLLAARVLSERYRQVLVVERDRVIGVTDPRRGVPHGRHAHALLAKGQQLMEELFPGLTAELIADGVLTCDLADGLRWYFGGRQLKPATSGLLNISATRPVLESHVRDRVAALSNVDFRERTLVLGLVSAPDGRVTGIRVTADDEPGPTEIVPADLVVDATGRGSRTPAWLAELGYERPREDKVKIDLAYTSRFFRLDTEPFGKDIGILPVATPGNPRGAFFGKLSDDLALLSLTGMLGDHPPRDDDGFLEYTRTLSIPDVYRMVRTAEPLGEAVTFRFPASVRRRYETLDRFPDGLIVVGDGVCSFNPVYAQGMTVAAVEAVKLAEQLDTGVVRPLEFFAQIAPIIDLAWEISVSADLGYPGVEGPRPLKVKLGNAFMGKLHTAAQIDGRFTAAFFRVAGFIDPPQALMRPRMVFDVLRTARRVKAQPAVPALEELTGAA